jgi:hypothetical protein
LFADACVRECVQVKDPSLLRFLVDLRGEDATGKQLRDDLMTFLIAGHETTAAVLTWCIFCLMQNPKIMAELVRRWTLSSVTERLSGTMSARCPSCGTCDPPPLPLLICCACLYVACTRSASPAQTRLYFWVL